MIGEGIRMANNAGLVTSTGGGAEDLLHTLSVGRVAVIRKITWYNPLGVNINILIGTYTTALVFAQLLSTIVAIPGLAGLMLEEELPEITFALDVSLAALGVTGDIYLQDASAGGLLIRLGLEEFGA